MQRPPAPVTRIAWAAKRRQLLIGARFGSIFAFERFSLLASPAARRGAEQPQKESQRGESPEYECQHCGDDRVFRSGDQDYDVEPGDRDQVHALILARSGARSRK